MSKAVQCLECGRDIVFFDAPVSGQHVHCSNCDADLEVIDAKTMELDWAYKPPVVRDGWQGLDVFEGTGRTEYADQEDGDDWSKVNGWDDDTEDESQMRDIVC